MGTLKDCKERKIEDFSNAIWIEKPTNYPYVRESKYSCCGANFKPIKKGERCWFYGDGKIEKTCEIRLIGYTKAEYIGNRIYEGIYWWLKGYDLGMPNEKEGYGKKGAYKDGKGFNIILTPSEAVKFIENEM